MSQREPQRADFMTAKQKDQMSHAQTDSNGNPIRSHQNCESLTGVSRPGKTAKDRYLRRTR